MFRFTETLDTNQIKIFGLADGLTLIDEDEFFKNREKYYDACTPIPRGVNAWYNGSINDIPCLISFSEIECYAIISLQVLGIALCHWVNQGGKYKACLPIPYKLINNKRRVKNMANKNLLDVLNQNGSDLNPNNLQQMQVFDNPQPQAQPQYSQAQPQYPQSQPQSQYPQPQVGYGHAPQTPMQPQASGVTSHTNQRQIKSVASKYGYLFGYIMKTAPAINIGTTTNKDSKDVTIVAKQSKPSQIVSVLIALPKRCCMKRGMLATPQEIASCNVDFESYDDNDLTYLNLPKDVAVAYLHAIGNVLPEYAPTANTNKTHWTPIDIASKNQDITHIAAHVTKKSGTNGGYNYNFKTDSPRKSLFTQKNHMCLTAQEHVKIKDNLTDKDAYELNEYAFGHLRNRAPRKSANVSSDTDCLTLMMSNCPTQLWAHEYTIDGAKVPGIMSCFFMPGDSIKKDNSDAVLTKTELEYRPWYETGNLKKSTLTACTSIVKREKDEKTGRRVPTKLSYLQHPNHVMFKPYDAFIKEAKAKGFIRDEDIAAMCSTTSRRKNLTVDDTVNTILDQQLNSSELLTMVEAVIDDLNVRNHQ